MMDADGDLEEDRLIEVNIDRRTIVVPDECGQLAAPVTRATGKDPLHLPNPDHRLIDSRRK